jgi:hypothetical protein
MSKSARKCYELAMAGGQKILKVKLQHGELLFRVLEKIRGWVYRYGYHFKSWNR